MKVSIHPTLNCSRGVIRCRDLAGKTEADIRYELSEQGVTLVKRVRRKDEGQEKDTNTLFFDFLQCESAKGYPYRVFESKGRSICPQSPALL